MNRRASRSCLHVRSKPVSELESKRSKKLPSTATGTQVTHAICVFEMSSPDPTFDRMEVNLHDPIINERTGESEHGHKSLRFKYNLPGRFSKSVLDISFRRTVRVPDNGRRYDLPPDCGAFPLFSTKRFQKNLPKDIADTGGVFLPIYCKSDFVGHSPR